MPVPPSTAFNQVASPSVGALPLTPDGTAVKLLEDVLHLLMPDLGAPTALKRSQLIQGLSETLSPPPAKELLHFFLESCH